jgi:RES domain-containing protein
MPEPIFEQLRVRLARLPSVPFTGVVYRSSTPKYATESDLITGEGSRRFGGRWNPLGIAMIYTSLTPETAMAETLARNRYYGIPIEDAMPRTFVAIDVNLRKVLDLRDGVIRRRLQISETKIVTLDWRKELLAGHEPITQRLGRAVHSCNWEGMIVPSAADMMGHNLLIFPEIIDLDSKLIVRNPEMLEKT